MNVNWWTMINCERDVRRWLNGHSAGRVFWVEHGAGGIVGMPDAWVADGPKSGLWVELKVGEHRPHDDILAFSVRPAQRQTMARLAKVGSPACILVGIKGVNCVVALMTNRPLAPAVVDRGVVYGRVALNWTLKKGYGIIADDLNSVLEFMNRG